MVDVWSGDLLVLLIILTYVPLVSFYSRPKLLAGPGINLVAWDKLQARYQKRYLVLLILWRVIPVLLGIYFACRLAFKDPFEQFEGLDLKDFAFWTSLVFSSSLLVTVVARLLFDKKFVTAHPEFQSSFTPIRPRLFLACAPIIPLIFFVTVFLANDLSIKMISCLFGFITAILGSRVGRRQVTHSRYELSWDDELGRRVSAVFRDFGFTPTKLVLLPRMMSNAYALPDGSVMVTSALVEIATPDEIAAVIAHELSHARDKEGKLYQRLRLVIAVPAGLIAGLGFGLGQNVLVQPIIPPLIFFSAISISILSSAIVGARTRSIEFKCDRDAAKIGLGDELASCLEKISRYNGWPIHWIGLDRYLLTHPSTDERIARLRANSLETVTNLG